MKFARRVEKWLDEGDVIREGLSHEGHAIVHRLCGIEKDGKGTMSLRAVARRTGLSATYISQILNRKASVSPEAYLKIAKLETKVARLEGK